MTLKNKIVLIILSIFLLIVIRFLVGLSDWSQTTSEDNDLMNKRKESECLKTVYSPLKKYEIEFQDSLQKIYIKQIKISHVFEYSTCEDYFVNYKHKKMEIHYTLDESRLEKYYDCHKLQDNIINALFKKYVDFKHVFTENHFVFIDNTNHLNSNALDPEDIKYLCNLKIKKIGKTKYQFINKHN